MRIWPGTAHPLGATCDGHFLPRDHQHRFTGRAPSAKGQRVPRGAALPGYAHL